MGPVVITEDGPFYPLKLEPAGDFAHGRLPLRRWPDASAPTVDTPSSEVDGGRSKEDDRPEEHAEEDALAHAVIP